MSYTYNLVIKKINPSWNNFINDNKKELIDILNKINNDYKDQEIYPYPKNLFRSLSYFSPNDIKLVILGQDPYINYEIHNNKKIPQAMGLSFSIPKEHKKFPPTLKNIFNEIKNCYPNININNGCLKRWCKDEKILLLNCSLTVIGKKSNSHQHLWKDYTNKLISYISKENNGTIFLLMGNFSINKSKLIDDNKHKIFKTSHASPLSYYKGFHNSRIFEKINEYLISQNEEPIDFSL